MVPPRTESGADDLGRKQRWEQIWALGVPPGYLFDMAKPLPELAKQLSDGSLPTFGNALVPGCGRGYDVEILSRAGYAATGLDISPTAVSAAQEYLQSVSTPGEYRVVCGDFFTDSLGVFDLVYDCTFFCALPLEMREAWGKRMKELVKRDGSLITMMYPMKGMPEGVGPPFLVSEKAYCDALGDAFVPVDGPRPIDEAGAHLGRGDGQSYWCRWKRV